MQAWNLAAFSRTRAAAKSLRFWYRTHYHMPPNDPRYLDVDDLTIRDEYEMTLAYNRMMRGDPDEQVFESNMDDYDLLRAVEALDGKDEAGGGSTAANATTTITEEWDDVPIDQLLKEASNL